jgi:hypothetical protein
MTLNERVETELILFAASYPANADVRECAKKIIEMVEEEKRS